MGRLLTCANGLQTATPGYEFTAIVTTAPVVETTIIRAPGAAAYRISNTGAIEGLRWQFSTGVQGDYYSRVYLYIVAYPSTDRIIMGFGLNGSYKGCIRVKSDGKLQLYNAEDNAQVGSDSAALSLNTWYRIEQKHDSTTLNATAVDARIDGVSFASGTIDLAATPTNYRIATTAADSTLDYVVTDFAINDTSGSIQNSWVGASNVFYQFPNGNGASSDFGGSDGNNTDNYLLVNEVPPDTATYVQDDTSGQIDDYALDNTPAAMSSGDIVNVVHVGVVAAVDNTTSTDPDIVLRFTAGGNTDESSNLDCNSTVFHGPAPLPANDNYQLTLYDMPGSSSPITKSDLDSAQVGVRVSATDANLARVALVWTVVDYTPGAGGSILPLVAADMANISDIGGMRG
jgi:hypothetical protein